MNSSSSSSEEKSSSSSSRRRGKRDKDKKLQLFSKRGTADEKSLLTERDSSDNDDQVRKKKKKKKKLRKKISNKMVVAKTILMSKLLRRNRRLDKNDDEHYTDSSRRLETSNHRENLSSNNTTIHEKEQAKHSNASDNIRNGDAEKKKIESIPSTSPQKTNIIEDVLIQTKTLHTDSMDQVSKSSHIVEMNNETTQSSPTQEGNVGLSSTKDNDKTNHEERSSLSPRTETVDSPNYLISPITTLSINTLGTPDRKYGPSSHARNAFSPYQSTLDNDYSDDDNNDNNSLQETKQEKSEVFTFNRIRSFGSIVEAAGDEDDSSSMGGSTIDGSIDQYHYPYDSDDELLPIIPLSPPTYKAYGTQDMVLPLLETHSFNDNDDNNNNNITTDKNDLEWSTSENNDHVINHENDDDNIPSLVVQARIDIGDDSQNSPAWKKRSIQQIQTNQITDDRNRSPSYYSPSRTSTPKMKRKSKKKLSPKKSKNYDKNRREQTLSILIGIVTAFTAILNLTYTSLGIISNSRVFDVTSTVSTYPKMIFQIVLNLSTDIYITIIASILTLFFGIHLPLQVQRKVKKQADLEKMSEEKKKKVQQFKSVNRHLRGLLTGYRVKEVRQENVFSQLDQLAGSGSVSPSMVVAKTKEFVKRRDKVKEQLRQLIMNAFMKSLVLSNNNMSTTVINNITLSLFESKVRQIPHIQYHPIRLNNLLQQYGSSSRTVIKIYDNLYDDSLKVKDRIFILPFTAKR